MGEPIMPTNDLALFLIIAIYTITKHYRSK